MGERSGEDELTLEQRQQLAENMRFYADMRFKQLTLFMGALTLTGAGVAQYPQEVIADQISVRIALASFALLFTGVFWVMEVRSSLYFAAQRELASDLWPSPTRTTMPWVNATNAILVLHVCVYLFWLYSLRLLGMAWGGQVIFAALFVFLIIFTVQSYWPLWTHKE